MGIHRVILFFLLILLGSFAFATDFNPLRIATTTSIKSSGMLDVLFPAFEQTSGYKLELAVVGTGRALRLGRLGKVDVILVHAPASEQQFVKDGWGVEPQPFMRERLYPHWSSSRPGGHQGGAECRGGTKKNCRN